MSTATWHIYAEATGIETGAPTVVLGAGAGGLYETPPGPNAPWFATGDGVSKYLSWTGNAKAVIDSGGVTGNDGASTKISAVPIERYAEVATEKPRPRRGKFAPSHAMHHGIQAYKYGRSTNHPAWPKRFEALRQPRLHQELEI